jgi:hypothetical protein
VSRIKLLWMLFGAKYHACSSFAARNILMQHGPLSQWPTFRLIDFGRSTRCDKKIQSLEERDIETLFQLEYFTGHYS